MPKNFDLVAQIQSVNRLYYLCYKRIQKGEASLIISNPHSNPQCMMSCATSAYVGSPRGLVSYCNT